jgi:hypothetical protein
MAGLRRPGLVAAGGLVLLTLAVGTAGIVAASDPGATARPPTCAERFPAEGPAGVDLRLGCIVSEVVGLWKPEQASAPPTLSAYAIAVAALAVASLGLALIATRLLARRASARLAATTPGAWWVCGACHSINGLGSARCYNCSAPRPADAAATAMLTDDSPATPQSFGRGKHG